MFTNKKLWSKMVFASLLSTGLAINTVSAGELTIYSSVEPDNLKIFSENFSKAHPSIKVNWVRDSTGVIQARVIAEKDNPRNDVFFGHAATDLLSLDQMGMFLPYLPKSVDKLDARYRDKKSPPTWTGLWGFAAAVCLPDCVGLDSASFFHLARPVEGPRLPLPFHPMPFSVGPSASFHAPCFPRAADPARPREPGLEDDLLFFWIPSDRAA